MIVLNVLLETTLNKNVTRKVFLEKLGWFFYKMCQKKDTALLKWRCEVKISESDLNKEICYHQIFAWVFLFEYKRCFLNYNMIRILFLYFLY